MKKGVQKGSKAKYFIRLWGMLALLLGWAVPVWACYEDRLASAHFGGVDLLEGTWYNPKLRLESSSKNDPWVMNNWRAIRRGERLMETTEQWNRARQDCEE